MKLSLGEFVKCLVLLLHRNGVAFSLRSYKPWHLLFYELKKIPETDGKPEFFKNLRFDWDGPYPECPELSEFLDALCWTGSIVTTSPRFEEYTLPKEMADLWSQEFEVLGDETKQFLDTTLALARNKFRIFCLASTR